MRTLFFILLSALTLSLGAQDDGYTMYETVILEPDNENIAALSEAMAEHNNTYHKEAPYTAVVWNITTGPNIGKMVWMMGPCTYSDLDGRPAGEHDDHWTNKVVANLEGMSHGEYWKRNDALSVSDGNPRPIVAIRYLELNKGQGYRLMGLLNKISEVVKASDDNPQWSVYINEFQQGYTIGRHIALVRGISSWAEFDEPDTMQEDYESHHGEGTWNMFLREWDEVIANSWDEIWTLNAEMSASVD